MRIIRRTNQGFYRLENRLGLHDHAFAAAEWAVIDGAVTIMGEVAQVVHGDVDELRLTRAAHDAVIEGPAKKVRENRDHVKMHGWNLTPIDATGCRDYYFV